jgi:hypothetical protein
MLRSKPKKTFTGGISVVNHKWKITHSAAFAAFLIGTAAAQVPVGNLIQGMAANNKQLRQYTYKQRTETYHEGELKNTKVDEIHYNAGGERVSIPLDQRQTQSEAPRRGPGHRLIARKIEEEKEKMRDYIERLTELASRYPGPDQARFQEAISKAEVTTGGGSSQVRIRMHDYVKPGDSMTMIFDPATKRPVKTEINTFLDDGPVSIVIAFDQLRNGPNYPGKIVMSSIRRQLEIRVFTYEYRL